MVHRWGRRLVETQQRMSRKLDDLLPARFRVDGNRDFIDRVAPTYLRPGITLYDVGGGKQPFLEVRRKQELGIRVVGLDIDAGELGRAPAGAYDETICEDVTRYRGRGDADLVVCQALLEHVPDTEAALEAIASMLKPGGIALLFVPSRHAWYARLNLLLPQTWKQRLLFTVFPAARTQQGFPVWYDRCTPRDMRALARRVGLRVKALHVYYKSAYFSFCFPLHALWRAWILAFAALAGDQAAETFTLVLEKPPVPPRSS